MNRRSTFPLLVFLILFVVATTQPSSAVVPDHGPSAFGQGEFSFFNGLHTEQWSYSFDAEANKNERTRGRAIFDILENSVQTHVVVKINCLNVVADDFSGAAEALMTGTVLHSDDPEFPKQANVIFSALDERGSSLFHQDLISRLFQSSGVDCHNGSSPLTLFSQNPDAIHIEP